MAEASWLKHIPEDGHAYYWCPESGESVWQEPTAIWSVMKLVMFEPSRKALLDFFAEESLEVENATKSYAVDILHVLYEFTFTAMQPERVQYAIKVMSLLEKYQALPGMLLSDEVSTGIMSGLKELNTNTLHMVNPFTALQQVLEYDIQSTLTAFHASPQGKALHQLENESHDLTRPDNTKGQLRSPWRYPTLFSLLQSIFIEYADMPLFGSYDPLDGDYVWRSYAAVWRDVLTIGSTFLQLARIRMESKSQSEEDLTSLLEASPPRVAMWGVNCEEWCISDLACFSYGLISTAIPVECSAERFLYFMTHAEVDTLVCSVACMNLLLSFDLTTSDELQLDSIVVMDYRRSLLDDELNKYTEHFEEYNVRVLSYNAIVEQDIPLLYRLSRPEASMATIVYTSGSTGLPKGSIMSFERMRVYLDKEYFMPDPAVYVSFAPLAHLAERQSVALIVNRGGQIGFYRGNLAHVFEDIKLVRPTWFVAVPRFYNMVHLNYQNLLAEKMKENTDLPSAQQLSTNWVTEFALRSVRESFGGRLNLIITGSAATSEVVKKFLRDCFQCPLVDGYGSTECGGITTDNIVNANVDVKLVDCPELGYLSTDKPFPRGELYVKTETMIEGYYKAETETKKAFTEDGYWATGDIGERLDEKTVRLIDRVKNVFKLAQGVFIAAEQIEVGLQACELVDQLYVHGDMHYEYLSCVCVPNEAALRDAIYRQHGADAVDAKCSFKELCASSLAEQVLTDELLRFGNALHLKGYEIPRLVVVESERFAPGNGGMTASFKLNRNGLYMRYKDLLAQRMAACVVQTPSSVSSATHVESKLQDVIDEISAIAASDDMKKSDASVMSQLGQDSLSAVRFASIVQDRFGTTIPITSLFNNMTVQNIADLVVQDGRTEQQQTATNTLKANVQRDLDTPLPFDAAALSELENVPDKDALRSMLLTGATGFLGVFVLEQLLRNADVDKVYCIVRGEEGADRLVRRATDAGLSGDVLNEFKTRVVVLRGDLAVERLGLSSDDWNLVALEVREIFHVGALVHWLQEYDKIRTVNVEGTLEVVRLATTHHVKRVHYVSTISTSTSASGNPSSQDETELKDRLSLEQALATSTYALSKWVAEHLILRARDIGLPVTVYRPGMVTGHSTTGFSNPEQYIDRVMIGFTQLGYFPTVFTPIEITPVDVIARWITTLGAMSNTIGGVFHLCNERAAVNFAKLGEAAASVGFAVTGVPYALWYKKLSDAFKHGNAKTNALFSLMPFLATPDQQKQLKLMSPGQLHFGCKTTVECLRAANVLQDTFDEERGLLGVSADDTLLNKYVKSLASRNLLPQL